MHIGIITLPKHCELLLASYFPLSVFSKGLCKVKNALSYFLDHWMREISIPNKSTRNHRTFLPLNPSVRCILAMQVANQNCYFFANLSRYKS